MLFNPIRRAALAALALGLFAAVPAKAQLDLSYHQPVLEDYFAPASATPASPDADGFIRRWSLLEPIAKPEIRTNAIFTDSYLNEEFAKQYFEGQTTIVPKDGQKVKLDKKTRLAWHCYDSKHYNVKLYRFAAGLGLHPTEALFLAVTVINVPEDVTVRMAVGSNSGSKWWINGEEAILLRFEEDHPQGGPQRAPRRRDQRSRHERFLHPFPGPAGPSVHEFHRHQPVKFLRHEKN